MTARAGLHARVLPTLRDAFIRRRTTRRRFLPSDKPVHATATKENHMADAVFDAVPRGRPADRRASDDNNDDTVRPLSHESNTRYE